jgi:hypothetical protein
MGLETTIDDVVLANGESISTPSVARQRKYSTNVNDKSPTLPKKQVN